MSSDSAVPSPSRYTIAAWILTGGALLLVLVLKLLAALLAGLLVYELVHVLAPVMNKHVSDQRAKLIAVFLLSVWVVGLITGAIVALLAFMQSDVGSLAAFMTRLAEILESSRDRFPHWMLDYVPIDRAALNETVVHWLRAHAAEAQLMGRQAGRILAHILVGMVLGAMVAMHKTMLIERRPLAAALTERAARVGQAFRSVVFAQVQISLLNTVFTGIYLVVVLPYFGIKLPFTQALILITFIAGLLPVVGNLISNAVIVVISLSYSLNAAVGALVFLVVIHKLEYFLNARIVGTRIRARSWEILIAMLVMEAAFGVAGVIAASIYYAYIKDELADQGMV